MVSVIELGLMFYLLISYGKYIIDLTQVNMQKVLRRDEIDLATLCMKYLQMPIFVNYRVKHFCKMFVQWFLRLLMGRLIHTSKTKVAKDICLKCTFT
jgi:hypothetical protein